MTYLDICPLLICELVSDAWQVVLGKERVGVLDLLGPDSGDDRSPAVGLLVPAFFSPGLNLGLARIMAREASRANGQVEGRGVSSEGQGYSLTATVIDRRTLASRIRCMRAHSRAYGRGPVRADRTPRTHQAQAARPDEAPWLRPCRTRKA